MVEILSFLTFLDGNHVKKTFSIDMKRFLLNFCRIFDLKSSNFHMNNNKERTKGGDSNQSNKTKYCSFHRKVRSTHFSTVQRFSSPKSAKPNIRMTENPMKYIGIIIL